MIIMKILTFVFLVAGFGLVFVAGSLVKKYRLDEKVVCNFEDELSEDEVSKYKFNKASVNLKMMGLMISVPGLILLYLTYK